ncbi:MAG: C-terminal binding protein [Gammaproteobacteria bacterium]|nr:C-terminal binding protein [Gammaproteobacteria bacterium]
MTLRILWPRTFRGDHQIENDALGEGFTGEFSSSFDDVTEEQWRNCDAIVGVTPPAEWIDKLDKCRILVKSAVGFDDVDLERWGSLGIPVCNTPDYGTREVADHAIALMMTLTKSIAFHDESLRADPLGNWRPALNPFGRRLSACTFGVVGAGRIGTAAIRRAQAFDMDAVFYDPYKPNGYELALGVRRADTLEELMGQCDIVSVHTPLNDETRNLIGKEAFAAAKPGIIVINTARGPIIDLNALHDAMKDDVVLAAGLDVLPDEPANLNVALIAAWATNEIWIKHRLVITPHSAFFTPESIHDIRQFSARTAVRYLRDGRLENCVNEAYLTHRR